MIYTVSGQRHGNYGDHTVEPVAPEFYYSSLDEARQVFENAKRSKQYKLVHVIQWTSEQSETGETILEWKESPYHTTQD